MSDNEEIKKLKDEIKKLELKQMDEDKKNNMKIAKEKGIKIWTEKEMREEYSRTGEDCNYIPLELVGKPSYFVSPTYDGQFSDREFIKVSDLKTTKVEE